MRAQERREDGLSQPLGSSHRGRREVGWGKVGMNSRGVEISIAGGGERWFVSYLLVVFSFSFFSFFLFFILCYLFLGTKSLMQR